MTAAGTRDTATRCNNEETIVPRKISLPSNNDAKKFELLRRFCTVSIGIPIVIAALARYPTYLIQASHFLCILEWLQLIPEDCKSARASNQSSARFYYPIVSLVVASSRNPLWLLSLSFAVFTLVSFTSVTNQLCQRLYFHHLLQGLLFVSVGNYHLIQISSMSFPHTLYFMFIVWNCDTGALLGGKLLGGKALFYRQPFISKGWLKSISPNKTVSGLLSGLLLGILTAVYFPAILKSSLKWCADLPSLSCSSSSDELLEFHHVQALQSLSIVMRRIIIGFVLSSTGLLGDLVESCVKRAAGKKDSGKLLPGHGGLMDRMDSMLISSGVYLWCFMK